MAEPILVFFAGVGFGAIVFFLWEIFLDRK